MTPPQQVVFVHHNQRDGRLSHSNATKAWAYLSRRSWQEKPKQLTIKIWEPPENALLDRGAGICPTDDSQDMIILPSSKFQQAYASKNCLWHIKSPSDLALVETTFSNVYAYNQRCFLPSPHRTADIQLKIDQASINLPPVGFTIQSGVECLLSHNYIQGFAFFECAARILQDALSVGVLENLEIFFGNILPALLCSQSRNAYDVVQLFLKLIEGLAAASGGAMHPLAVVARNLLALGITPELVDRLAEAELKLWSSRQSCSKSQIESLLFQSKCDCLSTSFALQEAERTYRYLTSPYRTSDDDERLQRQMNSAMMAEVYLAYHQFVDAACVLSDAPDQLAEWVEKGWRPTTPTTAPLSMDGIVWRLFLLAQALAGQGKHESADASFQSSISAGQKYYPPDYPILIRAQKAYAAYLDSRNRKREAQETRRVVDSGLQMYMLIP